MRENRDKVNARRRELHALAKSLELSNKKCLLCEIRLRDTKRVYCSDCVERFAKLVNRDKCRRYYQKNRTKVLERKRLQRQAA